MDDTGFERLFDFQAEDVSQLKSKRARLVGNEPGTGKTYEGLVLDNLNRLGDGNAKVDLKQVFPTGKLKTLIVCPKSVIDNWTTHSLDLSIVEQKHVYTVDTKNRHKILAKIKDPKIGGIFVVNWEFLRLELDDLEKVYFFHVIADECHRAKNRKSQSTRALKIIPSLYKTAMSGTPADDKPQDLWSILNWLWPNFYTSFWGFVEAYVSYEVTDDGYRQMGEPQNLEVLHKQMAPWYTRRLKKDVLPDLPDKYYTKQWVELGPKQRKAYDQMKKTMMVWIEDNRDAIERNDPLTAIATVSQLVRLQQYACGYLVARLDANGDQVHKRKHKDHPPRQCPYADIPLGQLFGTGTCEDIPQWDVTDPSAKLDALMELLEDRGDEQIIIWSQYKSVINLLAERLAAKEISYGLLTGDVGQEDRARNVQDFQAGKLRVFAGTIAAGGVGITLTAASTVVFIDRTWSPAINGQAEDRAHRIGQENAVEVIDLMARNTVDLGKSQKLALKWRFLQMILGDKVDTELIIEELEEDAA